MSARRVSRPPEDARAIAIPLQSAGLLSTLIFLISAVYEVLAANNLHPAQC